MTARKVFESVLDYAVITLGALVFCMAWDSFLIPNGIASGGLTGLCTVIQFATGIPLSVSFIVLNAVLLCLAFWVLGGGFGIKTIFCIAVTTVLFEVLPHFEVLEALPGRPLYISEKILLPIIGGLVEAVGISWIFRRGGSTGGTDIIALVLNKFWPISPGKVYMVIDLFIIASVLLIPGKGLQDMVYGYIAMLSFSFFLDYLMLGSKATVQVMVFSRNYEAIADHITRKMNRGVTAINSVGWYTRNDSKILLIIARKTQLAELTKAIKGIDPKAFVSVCSATGVYGEGFEEMKTGFERKKKNIQA